MDFLRSFAAIGIISMHVCVLGKFELEEHFYAVVKTLSAFVGLFFVLSGFSMCCGYYDKFILKKIDIVDFYKKKYRKFCPLFAFVVIVEGLMTFSFPKTIYEMIVNFTLLFSFMTNKSLETVSLGWTLGVIFAFYIFFPYFVFLIRSKKTAWISLVAFFVLHLICENYFIEEGFKNNIILQFYHFIAGGLIFHYRNDIINNRENHKLICIITLIVTFLYFALRAINKWPCEDLNCIVFSLWIISALLLKSKLFINKYIHFLSSISFDMYLVQMLVFRTLEKIGVIFALGKGLLGFLFADLITIISIIFLVIILKQLKNYLNGLLNSKIIRTHSRGV